MYNMTFQSGRFLRFFTFFDMTLQKSKKNRVFGFWKKRKNVFSNYGGRRQ